MNPVDEQIIPFSRSFNVTLVGDVMLGRLIDQLRSTHVDEPSEESYIKEMRERSHFLRNYSALSPWGDTLPVFLEADLNLINLETSVTTNPKLWPDKAFNYRMHPKNIDFLLAAKISYASLANNHTLDFCEKGLLETVSTLKENHIAFCGAGHTKEEALGPAILTLSDVYKVHVYSASDHPNVWKNITLFHHFEYTQVFKDHFKALLNRPELKCDLKIFSVHWGPNYTLQPEKEIVDLAHFLIDECGVDVIHGHSSHHTQGIEIYHGKLIIYGCGDFVDDYAINKPWRNDISGIWRLKISEKKDEELSEKRLKVDRLEILSTRIKDFQTNFLSIGDPDWTFATDWLMNLSGKFKTDIKREGSMLVVDL